MSNNLKAAQKIKEHRLLFLLTLIAITAYIGWRTFFTLPQHYGVFALIFAVMLLISEITAAAEALINYSTLSHYVPHEMPDLPEEWYPHVDVFVVTHNEPPDLLYITLNACTFMDYPDKSKIHIHLCDDGNRPEMAALAEKLGVNYWGLAENRDAKGGNLNNAIRQTTSPLCITFDADMVPKREFLMKTVPYFYLPQLKKDETGEWVPRTPEEIDPNYKVGFVQTPQGFYNPDLFQFNLYYEDRYPGEQDAFFQEINVARTSHNASLYAGSNTIISREALEEVDYIAVDTITEDILTGIRIQKMGYTCYSTSEVLAQGQAPITLKGLLNQRVRWGRGCIDTFRQEPILFSKQLTALQKLSYLGCYLFWWNYLRRIFYLGAPVATILFGVMLIDASSMWVVLAFWVPYYLLFNRALRVMSGNLTSQHWTSIHDTVLFPYLVGPILAEQVGLKQKKFVITDKKATGMRSRSDLIYGLPHFILLIAFIIAIPVMIVRCISTNTLINPTILFWLIIGAKNLLFSVLFMWGRDNRHTEPRFYFEEPVTVYSEGRTWETMTRYVSESEMAFYLDDPQYIPEDAVIEVMVTYNEHEFTLPGRIMNIAPADERWKYSLHVDEMSDQNQRYYQQYVHDREHSLPKEIDPSVGILDNFNFRIRRRLWAAKKSKSVQQLPHVRLDIPFTDEYGNSGMLLDFDYQYAQAELPGPLHADEALRIQILPEFELLLEPTNSDDPLVFRVLDPKQFITDKTIAPLLTQLAKKTPKEKIELQAKSAQVPKRIAVID